VKSPVRDEQQYPQENSYSQIVFARFVWASTLGPVTIPLSLLLSSPALSAPGGWVEVIVGLFIA
jgi:hypothetical protein